MAELTLLKNLVPGLVKKIGITDHSFQVMNLVEHELQKSAPGAAVVAYKNNKIYVELESPVQIFEFNLRKRELLKCLDFLGQAEKPELKFFLKGNAKPSAQDRLKNGRKNLSERN